jgi:alkylated DNA repair dioxygenase AlkB
MSTALDFAELLRREKKLTRGKLDHGCDHQKDKRKAAIDFDAFRLPAPAPDSIVYVPSFLTEQEGENLRQALEWSCKKEGLQMLDLQQRSVMSLGGTPHAEGMICEPLPPFAQELCDMLQQSGAFGSSRGEPNHLLVNHYRGGQGIGPHRDGQLYDDNVAVISLGREADLSFWSTKAASLSDFREGSANKATCTVKCEDRSLVLFSGSAYYDFYHGIIPDCNESPQTAAAASARAVYPARCMAEGEQDESRISFTIRRVIANREKGPMIVTNESQREEARLRSAFWRSVSENDSAR